MPKYLATINVPGYLPMDDDPPIFDTPTEAWAYLLGEREHDEDYSQMSSRTCESTSAGGCTCDEYSDTYAELAKRVRWARSDMICEFEAVGTVYGTTTGYDGSHDLGLAYSVSLVEDEED